MDIINIGLGVVTKKLKFKFYAMSKPTVKKGEVSLDDEIKSQIKNIDIDISSFKKFSNQALINEKEFYLDLNDIDREQELYFISEGLVNLDLGNAPVTGLRKKDFINLEKRNETIRFLIIEEKDKFDLLYLSQYKNILKNKKGFTVGNKATKFDIFYGIVYPNYITAILNKENWRLNVVNVIDFERMFKLKTVRLAKAKEVVEKFKKKKFTLGKDKLEIEFGEEIDLDSKNYQKSRQITYLSSFNPDAVNCTETTINEAMKHLSSDSKLEIVNKTIQVKNEKQFKTFAAILHDSILHRMISGKYEVI